MAVMIVLDLLVRRNSVTHNTAPSLVVTPSGPDSANARFHAEAEPKHGNEHAPTPDLNMADQHA